MKTISFIFITIAFLSLFVLGAQQQGCNSQPPGTAFNTTGLTLSFVDNAPPAMVNSGTTFPIYLKVENYGGYNVASGTAKFYLTGIGNNIEGIQPVASNLNTITKKSTEQEAGFEIIKFADQAESALNNLNNVFNFTMRADACYSYATHTEATVCIGQGDGMCPISGNKIKTGSNSNAPIQITNMTEQVQGNKLYISFLIENRGNGEVYYSNLDCDKLYGTDSSARTSEQMKKGYVEIYVDTGNEPDLKCSILSPSGSTIEGTSGMAPVGKKVTCSKIIGIQTNAAPLNINLAYKYINGISKGITIYP
jgi:hypothetical protein